MMDIHKMRANRDTAPVKFIEFMRLYKHSKDSFFCIVEGEDGKYYDIRIRHYCRNNNYHFLVSGGKEEVIRLHSMITGKEEYKNAKTMYFVDKDFDDVLNISLIYETPCYSIENLYTTLDAFSRILKNEFGLNKLDADYEKCFDLFLERQNEFHECVKLLNAWIACQRDLSNKGICSRLNLNNININNFVDIELDKVVSKYDVNVIHKILPDAIKIESDVLEEKIKYIEKMDTQKYFRGKFEIEFMRIFLEKLKQDRCCKTPKYFTKRKRIRLNLSRSNIISELSQYAETPACLCSYLQSCIA